MPERPRPAARQAEPEHHDRAPLITAHHLCRGTLSSPDGRLRAPPPNRTEIARSSTATPHHAPPRPTPRARQPEQSHLSGASVHPPRAKRNRQIPIAPEPRLHPAGSFPGGFRTPTPAHAASHRRPASVTLHTSCHSICYGATAKNINTAKTTR